MENEINLHLLFEGHKLKREKRYAEAIDAYKIAILHAKSAEVCAVIGYCYYAIASEDSTNWEKAYEAITWLEKAIELSPKDASSYQLLGEIHALQTGDSNKAIQAFRKALSINPKYVDALVSAASLYPSPGIGIDLNEATAWLKRAIEIKPDDPNIRLRLAQFEIEANNIEEAHKTIVAGLTRYLSTDWDNDAINEVLIKN